MLLDTNFSNSVVMDNKTFTTTSPCQSALGPWKKQMLTSGLSVIILIALLGNFIVVALFTVHKPLRKVANSFIVSLAVSDIMVGAVNMPIWIANIFCHSHYYKIVSK